MKQQPIRTITTRSTHRCKACGCIKKAGSDMQVTGVIDDDGKYTHIYRCVRCEGSGTPSIPVKHRDDMGVWQG